MSGSGPDKPDALSSPVMFRNPIRGAVTLAAKPNPPTPSGPVPTGPGIVNIAPTGGDDTGNIQGLVNQSNPGDTVYFAAGTYTVSQKLTFPPDRKYVGGPGGGTTGGGIAALTPAETMRLRAALAALNTQQLRSDNSQVLSRFVPIGAAVVPPTGHTAGGSGTGAILNWAGGIPGGDGPELMRCDGGTTTEISGFTFTGTQVHFENGAFNVHDNTFQDIRRAVFFAAVHDSHFDNNNFEHVTAEGFYGYPNGAT